MINSPSTSALNLISNAQYKAANAAHTIATLPVKTDEVGSTEFGSNDIIKPLLSLKEAELETAAAVKILQAEDKALGSLFDATA